MYRVDDLRVADVTYTFVTCGIVKGAQLMKGDSDGTTTATG